MADYMIVHTPEQFQIINLDGTVPRIKHTSFMADAKIMDLFHELREGDTLTYMVEGA